MQNCFKIGAKWRICEIEEVIEREKPKKERWQKKAEKTQRMKRNERKRIHTLNYVYCSTKICYSMKHQRSVLYCQCNLYRWLHTNSSNANAHFCVDSFICVAQLLFLLSAFVISHSMYLQVWIFSSHDSSCAVWNVYNCTLSEQHYHFYMIASTIKLYKMKKNTTNFVVAHSVHCTDSHVHKRYVLNGLRVTLYNEITR